MRAILIDSTAHLVAECECDGSIADIYRLLGCDTFEAVYLRDDEVLFVDEEGLLHDGPLNCFGLVGPDFAYGQPLAGNGLILGQNEEGETVGTQLDLASVASSVRFARLRIKDWTEVRSEENADTPFGPGFVIHGAQPIFEEAEAAEKT